MSNGNEISGNVKDSKRRGRPQKSSSPTTTCTWCGDVKASVNKHIQIYLIFNLIKKGFISYLLMM